MVAKKGKNKTPIQIQAQLIEDLVITRPVKIRTDQHNLTFIEKTRKLSTGVRSKEGWRKLFENEVGLK
jgi:thioesterase domain-containing protein